MKGLPEERAVRLAQYIIEKDATVRQAAKGFAISKSTVHKDVTQRLKQISPSCMNRSKRCWRKTNRSGTSAAGLRPRKSMSTSGRKKIFPGRNCPGMIWQIKA